MYLRQVIAERRATISAPDDDATVVDRIARTLRAEAILGATWEGMAHSVLAALRAAREEQR